MRPMRSSKDVATEPYAAREDDASGRINSGKKYLSANLCCRNWWRYTKEKAELFEQIGRLKMENEWLKKKLGPLT